MSEMTLEAFFTLNLRHSCSSVGGRCLLGMTELQA
jgi:hypothetical protein